MIRFVSAISLAITLITPSWVAADTCENDPNECTPKNLCEMTTELQGGQKVWTLKIEMSKHISVAKQLGMDCGAIDPKDPCDLDPNECKINELCERATTSEDNKQWNLDNPDHVQLAKKYSLNCDVKKDKSAKISSKCGFSNIEQCTDEGLCTKATTLRNGEKVWKISSSIYVNLAKERGLSCDVSIGLCSYENPLNCSDKDLCARATWKHSQTDVISWTAASSVYVKEAKKRSLKCGVEYIESFQTSICSEATRINDNGVFGWNYWEKANEVREAKSLGLSCDVGKSCLLQNTRPCEPEAICKAATEIQFHKFVWRDNEFAKEAKRRGLKCYVGDYTKQCVIGTPQYCSAKQICALATTKRTGITVWISEYSSYRKEAVKRGLSCGVSKYNFSKYEKINHSSPKHKGDIIIREHMSTKGTNYFYSDVNGWADFWESFQYPDSFDLTKNSNSVFPNLKREFVSLSKQERKKIQQNLKSKGYYKSTIDGLWGRNTLIALVEYSSVRLRAIDLRSLKVIRILLSEVRADYGTRKTTTQQGVLERVYKALQDQKNIQNNSSAFKSSFLNQSQLKRKQIQYALKQLGYYRSGIDGLWGNGTRNALNSFAAAESLGNSTPSVVYTKLLGKVSVPSSFSAPKQDRNDNNRGNGNNKGWVTLNGNPKLPFNDARDICSAKALAEGKSYLNANQPTDRYSSVNCTGYGFNSYNCRQTRGGGTAGAILRAWRNSNNRDDARKLSQAVEKACMADYGWVKR